MNTIKCPVCEGKTKRFGKTKAGTQRWQCLSCKTTFTHKINNDAWLLEKFLKWLLSKKTHREMIGEGRTFRRKTQKFWALWAMPPLIDEIHHVVYVDGIYLNRKVVVLIACSEKYVLGWYLARSENSRAYSALMRRIAPPDVVVCDGGSGFEKARRKVWSKAKVQRCIFHAFSQVRRYTTTKPRLLAGAELYGIAKSLLHIKTLKEADVWVDSYIKWCNRWKDFLAETTIIDGRKTLTHERLVKARNGLNTLISRNTLFTYLDIDLTKDEALPATNNKLEGGINARLRQMLRDHKGLNIERKIKAVFWWCYMHTECPPPPAKLLDVMPSDKDIEDRYRELNETSRFHESIPRWGDAIVWHELHTSAPYRMDWD